jgi:hypothetical protein
VKRHTSSSSGAGSTRCAAATPPRWRPHLTRTSSGRASAPTSSATDDANQEIDALELLGGDRHVVLGARPRELAIADVDTGGEIYNVFTIDDDKITRIEDYLQRDEALRAAGITAARPGRP